MDIESTARDIVNTIREESFAFGWNETRFQDYIEIPLREMQTELERTQQQLEECRGSLEKHGRHSPRCEIVQRHDGKCTCGFSAALSAANAEQSKQTVWRSFAQWPNGACLYCENPTSDTHATKEEAEGVCRLLDCNGFGGERKIFPVRTWVEQANAEQKGGLSK